ncbi:MAG TPA: ABC transporter permease [Anaerolineales bacterium]|nr:ABC transporter permease [Anaerolineales bacterium]
MSEENKTPKENNGKKSAGQVFLEELAPKPATHLPAWRRILQSLAVPVLAIFSGLVLGGLIIALTTESVYAAWQQSPLEGLKAAWDSIAVAYSALFTGAFGDPAKIVEALQSGDDMAIRRAFNPFFESLVASTPYIFGGLSVALGFRAGLFNIGAEGQIFVGAIFSAYIGYSITGLPSFIHMPLAFLAGALGGAVWGFIPGFLKAKTGGHEVINTIMMNYIAFRLSDWLLSGPMKRPDSFNPVSPTIQDSAKLYRFFDDPIRFHLGFFIALLVAWFVYWFLFKTKWGFDFRTVGINPHAARYAGMSVVVVTVAAMAFSGALAGLAGANEVLGLNHNLAMAFSSGYGFDAIALALLGNSHPAGVVLASLLFGTLRNGATRMQLVADIPIDIISILQALILAFIAAPAIIRTIYRLKAPADGEEGIFAVTWGGN